ncbi:ubiquitin-protein ligase-like protein [Calycina marina]|uniref:HECT-type E3 ubiquitin transferase n=1 Tax=Calycina marina TaxID=1763456 RepID=A0A9P7Z6N9_9HELO|nr:ubiquitin-protein ligase-like protein [Calycina marina]
MFQSFSGSSRRPRQVNLSGQNTNPFAASSWTPSGSGAQKTVAAAQQERQIRQLERDRLSSAKRIQRTWRGHRIRRELAETRRKAWDEVEASGGGEDEFGLNATQLLRLLITFFIPKRADDINRLSLLSQKACQIGYQSFLSRARVQPYLKALAGITLQALERALPSCPDTIFRLLIAIAGNTPNSLTSVFDYYYKYLKTLSSSNEPWAADKTNQDRLLATITAPLDEYDSSIQNDDTRIRAYSAFALEYLAEPEVSIFSSSDVVAGAVNLDILSIVLGREFSSVHAVSIEPERRLWLLANFIALQRRQKRSGLKSQYMRALSLQLSSSSALIMSSLSSSNLGSLSDVTVGDQASTKNTLAPLNSFVRDQLLSLVDQASITSLLSRLNIDQRNGAEAAQEDASLLSSYVLTLLRMFPNKSDEIRMWLFQGSMSSFSGEKKIPAVHYFWKATNSTRIFATIRDDPKTALTLLKSATERESGVTRRDREWRTILLFLELYNFVLRFTDDEEFLSANKLTFNQQSVSRFGESALRLEDVKILTVFLKSLAFATYFNASELIDDEKIAAPLSTGSLSTYFGASLGNKPSENPSLQVEAAIYRPFAGIAGMKFSYVRTIVTSVMRMLYERDSRRRFLPTNHWLMTSRFDMDGFIAAVVSEEERRQEYQGEEHEEEDDTMEEEPTIVGMETSRRAQQLEALRKQQQATAHNRYMVQVGPRLEVLQNMPFSIPFETRVQIFRQFVMLDQMKRRGGDVDPDIWRMNMVRNAMSNSLMNHPTPGREILSRHHAKIRRDQLFGDAFAAFYPLGDGLKEPIQITFVDKFDTAEAGIDGGGVTKEFLTSVTNEAFRAEEGPHLFVTNDQNLLYPNPSTLDERQGLLKAANYSPASQYWRETIKNTLEQYEFLGRVVGKCLYEGILIDVGFAGFFLLKWASAGASSAETGYRPNINDLRDFDESLYQGLLKLKNYSGDAKDLSFDFTIEDQYSLPGEPIQTITRELVPAGKDKEVTNENRPLYLSLVARHRLLVQPFQQTQAFLKGLSSIIKPSWLSMFNQTELQTLIGGDSSEINVDDLRTNTIYGGVYQIGDDGEYHHTVSLFWKVMEELDDEDRRKVLKYVTSTPRAPLLGFSQLNPRFSIRDAGSDEERLPSTSTCVNLLKLPRYSTAEILRNKLLYAVNSGAGFDLS